jgi:hypothetical protein
MIEDFKAKLIGNYSNQQQAFNNPRLWAHIYIRFEELPDGMLYSKSWYAIEGEEKPYRATTLELSVSGENVIMTPHNNLTNTKECKIVFEYVNDYWIGINDKWIISEKNVYISTFMKFDGINYYSRDAGYHLDSNQYLWGKTKQDGEFHFIKL